MLLLILWKFEKSRLPRFFFFFYSSVSLFLSLFLVFLAYVYCLWDVYIKKYESFHFIYLEVDTQETEAVFLSFFFYSVLYLFLCSFLFFSSFFFCMKTIAEEPDFLISSFSLISFVIRNICPLIFFSLLILRSTIMCELIRLNQ